MYIYRFRGCAAEKVFFADPALLLKAQVDPENMSCAVLANEISLMLPS